SSDVPSKRCATSSARKPALYLSLRSPHNLHKWQIPYCRSFQHIVPFSRMGQIKFGTDGWRAVIAEDFNFQNVERVAQATANHWRAHPAPNTQQQLIIGSARRFLSDQFAQSAAEICASNDLDVALT